jgi:hypothetical protein
MTIQPSISAGDAKSNADNLDRLSGIYDTLVRVQQALFKRDLRHTRKKNRASIVARFV